MSHKLAVAGCKHTTKDLIEGLLDFGFTIDLLITISPEKAAQQSVAGYLDLRSFADEKGIELYQAEKYSLKSDQDEEEITKHGLGVLLCMGWQRLIPEWFLNTLKVGAFGMHGSNKPLPHGRGRSPMNWSIIQGKQMFFTHLFKYNPGVDDGDIVGYQLFEITPFDNAMTMHFKNLMAMIKLCEKELPGILQGKVFTYPQKDVEPSFYPKRSEEDGLIFWDDSSVDIYNLCRAVTKPFPGAFTFLNEHKLMIWSCVPFDSHLRWDHTEHGEVVTVFYNGQFIVKTGDTSVLVLEWECSNANVIPSKGVRLHNAGIQRREWKDLPK